MLSKLRTLLRASLQDVSKTFTETFTASGRTFSLTESNASSISSVSVSGTVIASNKYSYNSIAQTVTIDDDSVDDGDAVIISGVYTKYSSTELTNYIRTALLYMDINNYGINFSIDSGDTELYPIPQSKEQSLIVIIATILVQPDWQEYRTATVTIRYPRTMTKDEKIAKIIAKFAMSKVGWTGLLELDGEDIEHY